MNRALQVQPSRIRALHSNRRGTTRPWILLITVICLLPLSSVLAQESRKIELLNANTLEFDKSLGENVRRLIGNVSFRHKETTMTCDSAYLFTDENKMNAFGNIMIRQGDTVTVQAKRLEYNGNTSLAQLYEDVVMSDRKMKLTTSRLDYNMQDNIAYYTTGGTLVDQENTLTSRKGYYYSSSKEVFFKEMVVLTNPRYTMTCDTLRYNTLSGIAYFQGPTTLRSKENFIYCEQGWYDTRLENAMFYRNAYLQSKEQVISGDTLFYNRKTMTGTAHGNVQVRDTVQDLVIKGDYGAHQERQEWTTVTGRALLILAFEGDSLYLHADTLQAITDTVSGQRILKGFYKVRFFKSDMQGVCDSLVYTFSDSTIRFYRDPVLWSDENQLTADSMSIIRINGEIGKVVLRQNSFICSREDTIGFNQIRGRNMTGQFLENKLRTIDVTGNGQTIYYALNKEKRVVGINRADCSDMLILIEDNRVDKITFINQPDATLFPPHDLKQEERFLKGFKWQESRRPADKDSIF